MKLVLITQDAPLYLPEFLDRFAARIGSTGHEIAAVVLCSPCGSRGMAKEIQSRLAYYGPVDFARISLQIAREQALSIIERLRPLARCHSVGNVLRKHRLRSMQVKSLNDASFVRWIRNADIDLLVCVACLELLDPEVLAAPLQGCINYHTALLPRYRGRQPLFWALLNNEPEVGISVHEMDAGLDNGPIIEQLSVEVEPDDTLHTLYERTIRLGPDVLVRAIEKVAQRSTERIPNDAMLATYWRFPTASDGRRFRETGRRFV